MFDTLWAVKYLCEGATSVSEMASMLEEAAAKLREMDAASVTLNGEVIDGFASLTTNNKESALRFGMSKQ